METRKVYPSLEAILVDTAEAVRPPERLTVSEAAEKYRRLRNVGSYVGPYRNDVTPYTREPQDTLNSTKYTQVCFVASSQSGKTEAILNWINYTVACDPVDLMVVEASGSRAADFSRRRVDRLIQINESLSSRIDVGGNGDNTLNKLFRNGVLLTLSHPSVNELSGKPVPRVAFTDFDRFPMDVGGEGNPFDLGTARTTSFGRFGMTFAESSPSFPVLDPKWSPSTPHEAPPTEGILALYNRGDRRRWRWICVNCHNNFEPCFSLIQWPADAADANDAGERCFMPCPHCGVEYRHDGTDETPGKHEMNRAGFWLPEGVTVDKYGVVRGHPRRTEMASFWLKGAASAFKSWSTLVSRYIMAKAEYDTTGSEEALKTTINTDQCLPFLPKHLESSRLPENLQDRAKPLPLREVPARVRFLTAAVDVQKNRFEVQIHGHTIDDDWYVLDRFQIKHSLRPDVTREGQVHYVRPFVEREDWRLIMREVMLRSYPLSDGSGRHMAVKNTIIDTGGADGATANAYEFYRWLRDGPSPVDRDHEEWTDFEPGLSARLVLYKGRATPSAPRLYLTHPDTRGKAKTATARGDVPVLLCNTTPLKDQISGRLDREEAGTGMVEFPDWLPPSFFKELCVEVKNPKGFWENPQKRRNESWDLLCMTQALLLDRRMINMDNLSPERPPVWAAEWDDNSLVFDPNEGDAPHSNPQKSKPKKKLSDLAKALA